MLWKIGLASESRGGLLLNHVGDVDVGIHDFTEFSPVGSRFRNLEVRRTISADVSVLPES